MSAKSNERRLTETEVPVINLAHAPGERQAWNRPKIVVYLWAVFELMFVTNAWQISSSLRVMVLRLFGAEIGDGVVFRPRTRVKFPWKLHVGDRSWIGEGVWIHNQNHVSIGRDVVISQESFITTGSHAHRRDMALITAPIRVGEGTWITSRSLVLGGTQIGRSCLIRPQSVVQGHFEHNSIISGNPAKIVGERFGNDEFNSDELKKVSKL